MKKYLSHFEIEIPNLEDAVGRAPLNVITDNVINHVMSILGGFSK
jgi:hypothetical protein